MKMTSLMLFTLLVLAGFCSCEKEEVEPSKKSYQKASIEFNSFVSRDDGDDDDELIVQGLVTENGNPIDSVTTSIYSASTDSLVGVSQENGFKFVVPDVGSYYFEILHDGSNPFTSEEFQVSESIQVTIDLQ